MLRKWNARQLILYAFHGFQCQCLSKGLYYNPDFESERHLPKHEPLLPSAGYAKMFIEFGLFYTSLVDANWVLGSSRNVSQPISNETNNPKTLPIICVCGNQAHSLDHVHTITHSSKDSMFACHSNYHLSFLFFMGVLFDKKKNLPSNQGVGASVMKNCDPFVLGPALAMLRMPAPVCFRSGWISSSNVSLFHFT